jgi:hypothetical protein
MTFLRFSWLLSVLAVLYGVLDSKFKLCAFYCQLTHQGGDWETKWSVSWFDCDESLTWWGLNSNLGYFGSFTFIFVPCEESCLLVSWWAGGKYDLACSDEDCGRSRRPGAEDRGWSGTGRVLDGRMIEWSGDAVCDLHRAQGDNELGFLGWASKLRLTVFQWFDLKTIRIVCQ